jgi:SnoaL-like domain
MSLEPGQLLDRIAIHDLMARYASAVDRRDWARVRDTFHPDAHDDHGEYKGGVDGFIAWVSQRHADVSHSMHFLGNCLIEFASADVAMVETYFIAKQTIPRGGGPASTMLSERKDGGGGSEAEIWGRYIDVAEKRKGEWRTVKRVVAFDVMHAGPLSSLALKPTWARSRRDQSDPLHAMRETARRHAQGT